MKKLLKFVTLLFIIFAITFSACRQEDKHVVFYHEDILFEVYPTSDVGNMTFTTTIVPSNLSSMLWENGIFRSDLLDLSVFEVFLRINEPTFMNFNIVEKAEMIISADGIPELTIARNNDIPNNSQRSIELVVVHFGDIHDYLEEEFEEPSEFKLIIKGTTSAPILDTIKMRALIRLDALVDVDH